MRPLRAFLRDRRGTAAVEFALIAPVLAGMVVGIYDCWAAAQAASKLHGALDAGAQFALASPSQDTAIRSVALSAWADKPNDGEVQVNRMCLCGTMVNVCTGLCSSNATPPSIYVTLTGSATGVGLLLRQPVGQSQVVRVR